MFNRMTRPVRLCWMDEAHRVVAPFILERNRQKVEFSDCLLAGDIRICIKFVLPICYALRPVSLHTIIRPRALALFCELCVWDTGPNSGMLFYLLLAGFRTELVAVRGFNRHDTPQTWQDMALHLEQALCCGE